VCWCSRLDGVRKGPRLAAWREVAGGSPRSEEPLTPIKLAAQRLQRRLTGRLGEDAPLFDECTQVIINQADEIKTWSMNSPVSGSPS